MLPVVASATTAPDEASILKKLFRPQTDATTPHDADYEKGYTYDVDDLDDAVGLLAQTGDVENHGGGYSGTRCYAAPYPSKIPTTWECIKYALNMPGLGPM
jgi:hypothetical protein